jgi:predicted RNase H-like HicB family nuclease
MMTETEAGPITRAFAASAAPVAVCHWANAAIVSDSMNLRLVVEFDPQTNRWSAVFPELPGCASAGDTEEEAISNAREALELWFEPSELELGKGAKLLEISIP